MYPSFNVFLILPAKPLILKQIDTIRKLFAGNVMPMSANRQPDERMGKCSHAVGTLPH
jgi:hypothetical protein